MSALPYPPKSHHKTQTDDTLKCKLLNWEDSSDIFYFKNMSYRAIRQIAQKLELLGHFLMIWVARELG